MQPKIHKSNADVKHAHSLADHAEAQAGEYEHQEYPKVIGRDEEGREVVAESAEHEEQLQAEKDEPYFVEPGGAGEQSGEDPEPSEDGKADGQ